MRTDRRQSASRSEAGASRAGPGLVCRGVEASGRRGSLWPGRATLAERLRVLAGRGLASAGGFASPAAAAPAPRGALLPGDELAFASIKFKVHLAAGDAPEAAAHEETEMLAAMPEPASSPGSDSDVRLIEDGDE